MSVDVIYMRALVSLPHSAILLHCCTMNCHVFALLSLPHSTILLHYCTMNCHVFALLSSPTLQYFPHKELSCHCTCPISQCPTPQCSSTLLYLCTCPLPLENAVHKVGPTGASIAKVTTVAAPASVFPRRIIVI